MQVNYFNEIHAVWEPLLERVDAGKRRWNLELEVNLLALFLTLRKFILLNVDHRKAFSLQI